MRKDFPPAGTDSPRPGRNVTVGDKEGNGCRISGKRGNLSSVCETERARTDNLEKALKDEMTRLHFWHDDAQVCSEIIEKFWADICGVFVQVEELA